MIRIEVPLAYAEHGFPVFPLKPGGKSPVTKHGFHDATTDEDTIREWWAKMPGANLGLPVQPGYVVLDVDSDAALQALRWQDLDLPTTVHAKTPRGHHFWYRAPQHEDLKPQVDILEGGDVDVRAPGSYVVAPPSTVGRKRYRWITKPKPNNFCDAPEWLLEACRRGKESEADPNRPKLDPVEILSGIPEGRRDWTLFRYACRLRHQHMQRREAEVLILAAASNAQPPFTEEEALRKVEQAWKYREDQRKENSGVEWFSLADVIAMDAKPIEWLCFPVLRPGLTLLYGPSKFGKSTLISQLCQGVSMGRPALGELNCTQAGVRYIDFEQLDVDDMTRHWHRLGFRPGDLDGSDFQVSTKIPRANEGGMEALRKTLDENGEIRLFVIDTLTLFWPTQQKKGMNVYHWESEALGAIREIAMDYGVCLVLVHHTNARGGVSGSEAMRGIPHTLLGIERDEALSGAGTLTINGRGIKSYHVRMMLTPTGWRIEDPGFISEVAPAQHNAPGWTN